MARRLGWLVGAAAILLVLARLTQVLEPAADTPDWRLIVPAAALGGILVTWATARLSPDRQVAIHLIALAVLVLRITASDTLRFGIVPTSETLPALAERMAYAAREVLEIASLDQKRESLDPATSLADTLTGGGEVNFTGFGKFHVAERSARQGVNPRTGERITIAGGKVPRFSAGSALKKQVKG